MESRASGQHSTDVLAVADGVVRNMRDGQAEHMPLSPQPEPGSLTAHGLFGNYVVLQIGPGAYTSFTHLQRGSVTVHAGERVHRGQLLGPEIEAQLFGQGDPWVPSPARHRRAQLPLDDVAIGFPVSR